MCEAESQGGQKSGLEIRLQGLLVFIQDPEGASWHAKHNSHKHPFKLHPIIQADLKGRRRDSVIEGLAPYADYLTQDLPDE